MRQITITSSHHDELLDITSKIESEIPDYLDGAVLLYTPHTTAGLIINEGADPDVQKDILGFLKRSVPWSQPQFLHTEGNSAAHIKAMLVGNDQMVIVKNGKLQLGTWERIFFCEFDGPRTRKVWIQVLPSRENLDQSK